MSIGTIGDMAYLKKDVANDSMEYYSGKGEKRGRWTGDAAAGLGLVGEIDPDTRVLDDLYNLGGAPNGTQLGRKFAKFRSVEERIEDRTRGLANPTVEAIRSINDEEQLRGERSACHAYDCTFSPPKSVSALWAISGRDVAEAIEASQDVAIDAAFEWLEGNAAYTRTGNAGQHHHRVEGLIVSRWEHRTSRSGDPQLHTHCAVLNRARTVSDGRWRAVDGTSLFASSAAANAKYVSVLEAEITERLGVSWEEGPTAREIAGIPTELRGLWSKRSADIKAAVRDTVGNPEERGTMRHSRRQHRRLMEAIVLKTRAAKPEGQAPSPDKLKAGWRTEAEAHGFDLDAIVDTVTSTPAPAVATRFDAHQVLAPVMGELHKKRSVWSTWEIEAAVRNALPGGLSDDNEQGSTVPGSFRRPERSVEDDLVRRLVDDLCGEFVEVTNQLIDPDGPSGVHQWTSPQLLQTEAELVAAAQAIDRYRPVAGPDSIPVLDRGLSTSQAAAVLGVATSTRQLDVVVGPAGSGKTTSMRAVAELWAAAGRPVIGLTTSQIAADQLAEEANIETSNLAMWRIKTGDRPAEERFAPGSLVIVDEASMVPTLDLHEVFRAAEAAGAKVLAVGDPMQLDAPGAGGAFGLLCTDDQVATMTLTEIHRFKNLWEVDATTRLRDGDQTVVDVYNEHHRLHDGTEAEMFNRVLEAWKTDSARGNTVVVTQTNDQASALSGAAREHLIALGQVDLGPSALLRDGNNVSTGDYIRTRRNNRHIGVGKDRRFVRNRDTFTVDRVHRNGSLTVTSTRTGGSAFLPPDYVAASVELGYAGTAHAVQGVTVDYAHFLCDADVGRQALYVSMTRARRENHAWVITDSTEHAELPGATLNPTVILKDALAQRPTARTATEAFRDRLDYSSLKAVEPAAAEQLHTEISTQISKALHRTAFEGSDIPRVLIDIAERHWATTGQPPSDLITASTGASFEGVNDPWAILIHRAEQHASTARASQRERPEHTTDWMGPGLQARIAAVTTRRSHLARLAQDPPPWVTQRIGERSASRAPELWDHLASRALTWADQHSTLSHLDPLQRPTDARANTELQQLTVDIAHYTRHNGRISPTTVPAPQATVTPSWGFER